MSVQKTNVFNKPPQSYWIESVQFPQFEQLNNNISLDVVIVGGGITGIVTAFMLKQTGLKIAVLDANQILHGTTAHTTAKITAQHDTTYSYIKTHMGQEGAKQYADANKAAILAIDKVIQQNKIQCDFSWQSAYVYTQNDKEVQRIQEEAKVATSLGFAATYLEQIPLPINIKAALRFDNQAQFHPLKFLLAVANLIPGNGSNIFENTKAININVNVKNGYNVMTNTGYSVTAPYVVIASHYPFYDDDDGMYYTRIHPSRSYAIGATIREKYPGGVYINIDTPDRSFRSTPLANGDELIIIVGEEHKTGQGADTKIHYQNLINTAESMFSLNKVLYRWPAQDYITLDQIPYIGTLSPNMEGLYVATGFRKWGISTAVVAAMIIKDSITGKENPWAPIFDPLRFKTDSTMEKIMIQKNELSKSLTKSKFTPVVGCYNLKPGEAKVFEYNNKKLGIFRDEDESNFHIVEIVCTHMGCELQWNSAEQSWDCPCHGSRFTYDGQVIEGPAKEPLNKIETIDI